MDGVANDSADDESGGGSERDILGLSEAPSDVETYEASSSRDAVSGELRPEVLVESVA